MTALSRSLLAQQIWMVQAITGREADAANARDVLTAGPRLSARDRFEVYRAGYRARLVECLADDYPVLAETLGQERFEALCHGYIDRYPSSSPSLNNFGRRLSAWCREASVEGLEDSGVFLSELAALEWALVEAIHAPVEPPFDFASLTELPAEAWANVRFQPSGSVAVLHTSHPVNSYYQARKDEIECPLPVPARSSTAIYRHGLSIWRMDLTPALAVVLCGLLDGLPLGEALSLLGNQLEDPKALAEAEQSVLISFREWVGAGFFSAVCLPDRSA